MILYTYEAYEIIEFTINLQVNDDIMPEQEDKMVLMDASRIERTLKRMAHQVVEDVGEALDLHVVGIQQRGYVVAERMSELLSQIYEEPIECTSLAVKGSDEALESTFNPDALNYDESFILLVDDVIFSGSTMFQALQEIAKGELPEYLHCAVLIDRGHRQLPVESKYVGMNIPTKLNEHVALEISSDEQLEEVNLFFE